jgi:acyl-CoA thioester hydrolase
MIQLNFECTTSIRVRYGETDQMGYCYYGNYAQFFEVGRVEALRSVGMSYKDLEDSGVMLPVSRYEVDFLAPAFYDDLLEIKTKITRMQGSKITFEYEALRGNSVLARGMTILVFVNKSSMRPIRPPQNFLTLVQSFIETT